MLPSGRILGVGTDLCKVSRLAKAIDRHGERFLARIFSPLEIEYCQSFSEAYSHYAARFAAKEAMSKCLGTGIGKGFGWQDSWIVNLPTGQPELWLSDKARTTAHERLGAIQDHVKPWVSLSHDSDYALAMVVLTEVDA